MNLFTAIALFALVYMVSSEEYSIIGASGNPCVNECLKRNEDYYYCRTHQNLWEYCSPINGASAYGKHCVNECSKIGEETDFHCGVSGGREPCSLYSRLSAKRHITRYGYFCNADSQCEQRGQSYFWCRYTAYLSTNYWEYCSPNHNMGYQNNACNSDHYCGNHGRDYYWCNIAGSWDYCGAIQDCTFTPYPQPRGESKKKNITQHAVTKCQILNYGRQTVKYIQENVQSHKPSGSTYTDAVKAALAWNEVRINPSWRPNHRIVTVGQVSIELSRYTERNNRNYGVLRMNFRTLLVSEIWAPMGQLFHPRFFRRALLQCLPENCRIVIEVN